jgi:cytochrome c oxidase subunit 2
MARQFAYEPDLLEVGYGEKVMLTVTSIDVGHGFALPDFGINTKVPPEESVTVIFTADKRGEFRFFNPVYSGSGWRNMTGKMIVK